LAATQIPPRNGEGDQSPAAIGGGAAAALDEAAAEAGIAEEREVPGEGWRNLLARRKIVYRSALIRGAMMESAAKLITSLAALVAAIAWPAVFLVALLVFRRPFKELVGRLRKGKVGFVEVELEQIALSVEEKSQDSSGLVTVEQVHSAARIKARSDDIGRTELLQQLDALCLEYDALRRTLSPSNERTRAMTRVIVKMRLLGLSVVDQIAAYKSSGSPGSRLAAIAIMQMTPQAADLDWLLNRFNENQPFIFYHAALALQNLANTSGGDQLEKVINTARQGLNLINSFDGKVDQNSVLVLNSIIDADRRL
jgi:hypothetical protein